MNLAETLRGLLRRWYIVVPGLLLAVAVAIGAWSVVKPAYERTATQLLIPGQLSLPENANPFLFLGGLSNAADVLVRAIASESVLNEVLADQAGAEVEISRDGSTSGPVILITVTGRTDAQAELILGELVERTATQLDALQDAEQIPADNRITVMPITIDDVSTLQQRDRLVVSGAAGLAVAALAVVVASLVDGLGRQRRRRPRPDRGDAEGPVGARAGDDTDEVDEVDEIDADDETDDEDRADVPDPRHAVADDADADASSATEADEAPATTTSRPRRPR